MVCGGVLIKGGSEGFRMMPPEMTKKVRGLFATAGAALASTGQFDRVSTEALAKNRKLGFSARLAMGILKPTGLLNFYWNSMLKKHRAMDRRFDAPHGQAF
jgi:energy-converting hydrogenase Eha subunit H